MWIVTKVDTMYFLDVIEGWIILLTIELASQHQMELDTGEFEYQVTVVWCYLRPHVLSTFSTSPLAEDHGAYISPIQVMSSE